MKTTRVLATLSASMMAIVAPLAGLSSPAIAHTACRIDLPFGGWTEGCPHLPHVSENSENHSCTSIFVAPAEYTIVNRTSHNMSYLVNDRQYRLLAGEHKTHRIGGGSNGCNVTSTSGNIAFDWSYRSGYQREAYVLRKSDNASIYYFSELPSGNGVDLYMESLD